MPVWPGVTRLLLGFVDSDGDIDPAHLVGYLNEARTGNHHIVFANKKLPRPSRSLPRSASFVSTGFST